MMKRIELNLRTNSIIRTSLQQLVHQQQARVVRIPQQPVPCQPPVQLLPFCLRGLDLRLVLESPLCLLVELLRLQFLLFELSLVPLVLADIPL